MWCAGLSWRIWSIWAIDFDFERNDNFKRGVNLELSKPGSKVKVWIVPTNEELVIATDTYELTKEIR